MPQNNQQLSAAASACVTFAPTRNVPDLVEDVRQGLFSKPRSLPSKYFYDERGSQLFTQICKTPEYYLPQAEAALLSRHGDEIIRQTQSEEVMELGSGNAEKTRYLLNAYERTGYKCSYLPIDICSQMLEQVTTELRADYDWLTVKPLVGDYHAGLGNLPRTNGSCIFLFLGGTIGNFYPDQARAFIDEVKNIMQPGDYFLLGADRLKDRRLLNAAYNDTAGITAEFNLNVLHVLNRELDANFDPERFRHKAEFNPSHNRVEMYLVCAQDQTVNVNDLEEKLILKTGDSILTEISHKFTFTGLEALIEDSGLSICEHYQSDDRYFSLVLATLPAQAN